MSAALSSRLAIFDCDGTLVDSQASICRAMEEAFVTADLPPPPRQAIRRTIGLSLIELIRVLWPAGSDAGHRALVAGYRDSFQRLRATASLDDEPLFEGVADTLTKLRDNGWLLGVATGKSDRGLAHVLARHGIADLFVTLQTADRHPSKPDPAMLNAALAEAGVSPSAAAMIGVAWGYHSTAELADAGADVIAEHASDLPRLLA